MFVWYITTFGSIKQVTFYQNLKGFFSANVSILPKNVHGVENLNKKMTEGQGNVVVFRERPCYNG